MREIFEVMNYSTHQTCQLPVPTQEKKHKDPQLLHGSKLHQEKQQTLQKSYPRRDEHRHWLLDLSWGSFSHCEEQVPRAQCSSPKLALPSPVTASTSAWKGATGSQPLPPALNRSGGDIIPSVNCLICGGFCKSHGANSILLSEPSTPAPLPRGF